MNPFAPHLTEELWEKLGHKNMLVFQPWPKYDAAKLEKTTVTMVVSVNGKRAADFQVPVSIVEAELIEVAKKAAAKRLEGAEIIKTIVVPNRMVNFVVKK